MTKLEVIPMTFDEANSFIKQYHRHHPPQWGCKFCVGVSDGDKVVGVAIIGRPVNRFRDDGWTLEVTRSCTDGTANANSMLYGAAWRATRAMGYKRLITYTLQTESGVSLRAANMRIIGITKGETWNRPSRPRVDKHPLVDKFCWGIGEIEPIVVDSKLEGKLTMRTDAEIKHINEVITDTLGEYYENEDGELQPIPDDAFDGQKREEE